MPPPCFRGDVPGYRRWTPVFWHSADEQKGPGDSQRTRARLRSLPSSCIHRGAACPYQIFACASAPRSTPQVPMAQHWPRSPLGPMPEISFARPPSPTAGHSNPIVSLRRQRASPVEAREGYRRGVSGLPWSSGVPERQTRASLQIRPRGQFAGWLMCVLTKDSE